MLMGGCNPKWAHKSHKTYYYKITKNISKITHLYIYLTKCSANCFSNFPFYFIRRALIRTFESHGCLFYFCFLLSRLFGGVLGGIFSRIILDYPGPWYRRFSDHQPSTLAARVDRLVSALNQSGRPVAQKMRTGLFYIKTLVLGKNRSKFVVLI